MQAAQPESRRKPGELYRERNKITKRRGIRAKNTPSARPTIAGNATGTTVSKDLDNIDFKILQEIQADGRMTNIELARRVGISPPPCLRRVRALEQAGLIRGYHADLAPEALGFGITVFAQIGLASQAEADLQSFEALVAGWPEVREAHMLAGETDFILK